MTEQERFEQSVAARLHPARFTKVGENPILGWNGAKDTDYVNHNIQQHWETWQAATAQAVPQVEGDEYLVVNFGYGSIEVAEGISEDAYALILGNNGGGVVGADLQGNRHMTKKETIAVLKFHSLAAIEVVIDRLDVLRERMKNNDPVYIKNSDGEVIRVVTPKLQAAQEDK